MQTLIATGPPAESPRHRYAQSKELSLVILWSAREPHRVGQRALCPEGARLILGRAPATTGDELPLCFHSHRPHRVSEISPASAELLGEALSRRQLELVIDGEGLRVRSIGRCPMWVNGVLHGMARVVPGDTIHLQQQLLLLCVERHRHHQLRGTYPVARLGGFGHPDQDGMVGESLAMYVLRDEIAACAKTEGHVLILGPSGVGKELVAQSIHQLSDRRQRPLISENIATLPASLGAALLFGNRKNFPNPGMEERKGLIGMAEGGCLFLDELGDMMPELQPMLLRVMEHSGEYLRMGEESQPKRANVRFIAATNHPERLRPELRRRFHHEIVVPSLQNRTEDIPLLMRHRLRSEARHRLELSRFLQEEELRVDPLLIEQLVHHPYTTHVSELSFLLEQAVKESTGDVLLPIANGTQSARTLRLDGPRKSAAAPRSESLTETQPEAPIQQQSEPLTESERSLLPIQCLPSPQEAQRALDATGGKVVKAAALLSITRHQLNRLIRRSGLQVVRSKDPLGSVCERTARGTPRRA